MNTRFKPDENKLYILGSAVVDTSILDLPKIKAKTVLCTIKFDSNGRVKETNWENSQLNFMSVTAQWIINSGECCMPDQRVVHGFKYLLVES